jgi:hypothetical protein
VYYAKHCNPGDGAGLPRRPAPPLGLSARCKLASPWSLLSSEDEEALAIDRPQDRRQFGRRPVFKPATIVQSGGQRTPATVLNVSDGGARLKIEKPELVETEFYLEIPEDDFIVRCRLLRLEDTVVAVQFIKAPRRLSWLNK